ncbi:MAG: Fic protein involved in cell division, partial [Parcubacteria group bacterium Greene1014_47]
MNTEEPKYISLQEATQFCNYSQEYLSLRARSGKLRAVKIGRNWVTTKEWLEEYVGGTKKLRPPENLPMEEEEVFSEPSQWLPILEKVGAFALASLAVVFFATGGIAFGKDGFFETTYRINGLAQSFGKGFDVGAASVGDGVKEYAGWLGENISALNKKVEQELKQNFNTVARGYEELDEGFFETTYRMNVLAQEFGTGFDMGLQAAQKGLVQGYEELKGEFETGLGIAKKTIPENLQHAQKNLAQKYEDLNDSIRDTYSSIQKGVSIVAFRADTTVQEFGQGFDVGVSIVVQDFQDAFGSGLQFSAAVGDGAKGYGSWFKENITESGRAIKHTYVNLQKGVTRAAKNVAELLTKEEFVEPERPIVVLEEEKKTETPLLVREIEVSRVTRIEPVREIVREVVVADNVQLVADMQEDLQDVLAWRGALRGEIESLKQITAKLQSTPPSSSGVSAPIYISSGGLQVGGNGTFSSLGVSGFASVDSLSIGRSATISQNLIVGAATSVVETLANPGFLINGDDLFVAGSAGIKGNIYTDGTLIVGGGTTIYGDNSITIANAGTLTVTDGTNTLFSVVDNGTTGTVSVTGSLDLNNTTTTAISANANAKILNIQGTFIEAASGVHARMAGLEITPPTITAGVATVTDTASLYISAAPTATVTGANYALWVDAGTTRLDGNVGIGTATPLTALHISSTDGLIIPVGTTGQRPGTATTGTIRYNATTSQFEGFGTASWGSLGGLIDVDQDTYISAETSPGADNDELRFFTAGTERMRILITGNVGVGNTASTALL